MTGRHVAPAPTTPADADLLALVRILRDARRTIHGAHRAEPDTLTTLIDPAEVRARLAVTR